MQVETLSEHLNAPLPIAELRRRWRAVRTAMCDAGIDVLLMQNSVNTLGGYAPYFTDNPEMLHPLAVVFPRDDEMTVVTHGPLDVDREIGAEGDGIWRGVKRFCSNAAFASAAYTRCYDAKDVVSALAPYARGTIGLVGSAQMSFAFVEHVRRELPAADFVEASDLVDAIKAIKSDTEQEIIRRCAAVQEQALRAAVTAIEPGKRGSDVLAAARRVADELGSEGGVYLIGTAPLGTPLGLLPRHLQHRVIQEGDCVHLLVECNGPGGMYTELGRTCVLGKAPEPLLEEMEIALAAQRFSVSQMRPGKAAREIWDEYNGYLADCGRQPESRLHSHGQGYDLVERPLIRHDETMAIAEGMNIACHPVVASGGYAAWVCDNWLIGPAGAGDRLHGLPQDIIEIG